MSDGPPVATDLVEANAIIAALWEQNRQLREQVRRLEARVVELEAQLAGDSSNSSRPPSSDPPWRKKRKRKPPKAPSGRKPGGQPGHQGKARQAVPPERVDIVVPVLPERCSGCGDVFPDGTEATRFVSHQVVELPKVPAFVTEYQMGTVHCVGCGTSTRAERPGHVPASPFGPRLQAVVATMTSGWRLSRRLVQQALSDLFDLDISLGTLQGIHERVGEAVALAVDDIAFDVAASASVHADETGWRQRGDKRWLWVASSPDAVFFHLDKHRGRDALAMLLPDNFEGVLHCDRWRPYERFDVLQRQLCHAHLRRDFQALIDRGGEGRRFGQGFLDESDRMFKLWHRFQRDEVTRDGLADAMEPIWRRWEELATEAAASDIDKARPLGKDMLRQWDALWTFVYEDGAEPTNNDAEQEIRPAVLWRKTSFGTASDRGSETVARMLSVVRTARRRGVDLLDWLHASCRAAAAGTVPPELRPTPP